MPRSAKGLCLFARELACGSGRALARAKAGSDDERRHREHQRKREPHMGAGAERLGRLRAARSEESACVWHGDIASGMPTIITMWQAMTYPIGVDGVVCSSKMQPSAESPKPTSAGTRAPTRS